MHQLLKLELEGERRDGSARLCGLSLGRAAHVLQRTSDLWQIRPGRSKNGQRAGGMVRETRALNNQGAHNAKSDKN